jgi:hypothetical protein
MTLAAALPPLGETALFGDAATMALLDRRFLQRVQAKSA